MAERITLKISPTSIELVGKLVGKPGAIENNDIAKSTSILICALMERLERLKNKVEELNISYADRNYLISVRATGEMYNQILESFELVWCGFELLKAAFPKNIVIDRYEEGKRDG